MTGDHRAEALGTGGPGTCKFPGMGYIIIVRIFWISCRAGPREPVVKGSVLISLGVQGRMADDCVT